MKLRTRQDGEVLNVTVTDDRIDALVAVAFKDAMRKATNGHKGRIILNLGHVDFIDSSGLGSIVAAFKLLSPDATLELSDLTPNVDRVFRLTRMDSVFTIHAPLEGKQRNAG